MSASRTGGSAENFLCAIFALFSLIFRLCFTSDGCEGFPVTRSLAMYLTRRQREMLDAIERFIQRNGYSPTLEEIGRIMGLSSLATVHKHLQNLEAKGLIRRNWNHSRAIEITQRAAVRGGMVPL